MTHLNPRAILLSTLALASLAAAETFNPATRPTTNPALWDEMTGIDAKVARTKDLVADFEQRKHTPLLKRPLISSGTIKVKGSRSLWTTTRPEPTVMLIDAKEIQLYYPQQKAMEVYPVIGRLGELAASPLPRLDVLGAFFSFERMNAKELADDADDKHYLALRMTPIEVSLSEHVREVRVLLDRRTGFIREAETLDADGDRTVIVFSNVRADTGLSDDALHIDVPAGIEVTRPLDAMKGRER